MSSMAPFLACQESNGLSVRRRVRRVVGSPAHHRLAERYRVVSDWACFILPSG